MQLATAVLPWLVAGAPQLAPAPERVTAAHYDNTLDVNHVGNRGLAPAVAGLLWMWTRSTHQSTGNLSFIDTLTGWLRRR